MSDQTSGSSNSNPSKPGAADLEAVTEEATIVAFLTEASKIHSPTNLVLSWIKGPSGLIRTPVTVVSPKDQTFCLQTPKDLDAQRLYRDALKHSDGCIISISLTSSQIVFKATFLTLGFSTLKFRIPKVVHKIQRRGFHRFKIPVGTIINIEFTDPTDAERTLTKKIIDVSAGGLSFETTEIEAPKYSQGLILKEIKFTLNGKLVQLDAEVRHIHQPKTPDRKIKIGLLFQSMKPGEQDAIASYVFNESSKYYARLLS